MAELYFGLTLSPFFDVLLHVASLLVVLVTFRNPIINILKAVFRLDFKSEEGRMALFVIMGSIPTGIIGFLFQDWIKSVFFGNSWAIGIAFLSWGTFMFVSFIFIRRHSREQGKEPSFLDSFLVGVAQGIALIPGVSRSGMTITTAMLRKVDKMKTFTFSFLLFIPAVIGATIGTATEAQNLFAEINYLDVVVAFVVAFAVGFVALRLLSTILMRGKFHWFAYYCWAIGIAVLLTQASGLL
jgi:undecaprenyl-diphosphatase